MSVVRKSLTVLALSALFSLGFAGTSFAGTSFAGDGCDFSFDVPIAYCQPA
ncbi:hypothetical protein ACFY8H_12645 [Streptomyces bacillaris]|uniref:hypothetical protein n=1 Tax=Streptomyces bacillaris TaxID=68179 RepID=UPI0036959DA2